ncbi:hypothetical protein IQ249_05985 [Lusitaniella coriacea LEGE 07157]|uniref:Uncharacterized protein n=1 Tax=Lusitaniella coriacea LEGE 07157 TaxID=945747 RepID=A0A8J7DT67_9CYAN|nr:hypothetical protein [Lusitaniella coriacea]MBE9115447.1 hypothetical protein [Lusitaniella coriacea LEGE 07157]
MDNKKLKLWNDFCGRYFQDKLNIPLFSTNGNIVNIKEYGKNNRLILQRSEQMENLVIEEVSKVIQDFEAGTDIYEGLIYTMYYQMKNDDNSDLVVPLYIGKSEKFGNRGNNLSANIKGINNNGNKNYFCRWGDNYAYHIGNLSAVICPNHPHNKIKRTYQNWASLLFDNYPNAYPSNIPRLKKDVFFLIHAWQKGSIGIFPEFGNTTLTALEYQLISVAATLFPKSILNQEGVNRRRTMWLAWLSLYSVSFSEYLLRSR